MGSGAGPCSPVEVDNLGLVGLFGPLRGQKAKGSQDSPLVLNAP